MRIKYEHDFKLLHKMCMLKSFYAKNISQKRKRERKSIQYDIRPRKKIHLKKKKNYWIAEDQFNSQVFYI